MSTRTVPSQRTKTLFRITQTLWYILSVIETFLFLRFLMKLIGANPQAGFSQFIYGVTYPFAQPFLAVIPNANTGASVFEWTTLLAMLVYWLFTWIVVKFFLMQRPVSEMEADEKLEEQEEA